MPPAVLSVRVNDKEHHLLRSAADHAQTNISDFIRRKALEAAEMDLMDIRRIEIPAEKWESIEALLDAPARDISAIRRLNELSNE